MRSISSTRCASAALSRSVTSRSTQRRAARACRRSSSSTPCSSGSSGASGRASASTSTWRAKTRTPISSMRQAIASAGTSAPAANAGAIRTTSWCSAASLRRLIASNPPRASPPSPVSCRNRSREQLGVPAFVGAVLVQPGGEPARRRRRRQHRLPGGGLFGVALGLEVKPHQQRLTVARPVTAAARAASSPPATDRARRSRSHRYQPPVNRRWRGCENVVAAAWPADSYRAVRTRSALDHAARRQRRDRHRLRLLDAAEALLVPADVVLQRPKQPLGVARRRDDARAHPGPRRRRLDVGEVEHELVLVVVDEDEVRVGALRRRVVDVDLQLRRAGRRLIARDPSVGRPWLRYTLRPWPAGSSRSISVRAG